MEGFRYLEGVASLRLDEDECNGCGICTEVCPHQVLALNGGTVRIVDRDACMECGACAENCPLDAVSVNPGVGCAGYILESWIHAWFPGSKPPACGCA